MVTGDPASAVSRIETAVDDLDLTVKHIRMAIFELEQTRSPTKGLREQILDLVREAGGALGFEPRVLLDGPVETGMDDRIGNELLATLREALSNVARHARATKVEVTVAVEGDVCLLVTDNGLGPPADDAPRGNGLRNMTARAELLGGTMRLEPGADGGSVLTWRAPKG
jgi:signal transduction histidine kinase